MSPLQSPKKGEHLNEKDSPQKLFKIGSSSGKVIKVPVHINGQQTFAIVDTGAEVTVLSEEFVKNSELHYSGGKRITTLLKCRE